MKSSKRGALIAVVAWILSAVLRSTAIDVLHDFRLAGLVALVFR